MRVLLGTLVAAAALGCIAGGLWAGPDDPGARTTWVAVTSGDPVFAADPVNDVEVPFSFVPFVDWDASQGAAQPIGATLTLRITQDGGGFDQTFSVPVQVPTTPGRQRPLTGPGGTPQEGGVLSVFLPTGSPLTNSLAFHAEATYQVEFGPGTGTGTSVSTASTGVTALPESPIVPGEPLVSCTPMTPTIGRFDVRRGTQSLCGFLIENNHPEEPCYITATVRCTDVSIPPGGTDPDGASYALGGDGSQVDVFLFDTTVSSEPPLLQDYQGVKEFSLGVLVPADDISILATWVSVPGDAQPNAAQQLEIDLVCEFVSADGPRPAIKLSAGAVIVADDRPPIAGDATVVDRVASGAFTSTEWSPAEITIAKSISVDGGDNGAGPGGFGGSVTITTHEDVISPVDIKGRTVKTLGIGAQGSSLDTVEHTDTVPTPPGRPRELAYSASSARGTGVLLFTHNETSVTLPPGTNSFRSFVIGTGPNSFADFVVSIDVAKDRIVVGTPKLNNQPARTIYDGSYEELLENGAPGVHVFTDTFRDITYLPPGGTAHLVGVDPPFFAGSAAIESTPFHVAARTVGGTPVPYFALPGGPFQTASGAIGTGTGDLFFGSVVLAPSTTVAGLARVNSNGNSADTASTYIPLALRAAPADPPLPLEVPGLSAVFDLGSRERDKATLKVFVLPHVLEQGPLKGKLPLPESCRRVILDVGGFVAAFDLDAKGKAKSSDGRRSCKAKFTRGRDGTPNLLLTFKLKRSSLRAQLADDGVRNVSTDKTGASTTVPVRLVVCNSLHAGEAQAVYLAKAGKKGKLKLR